MTKKSESDDLERLLTVREVAEYENVSAKTITRRIASGELPALRTGCNGRAWRICPRDLRAWRLKRLLGE